MTGVAPPPRRLEAGFLGRVAYEDGVALQEERRRAVIAGEACEALLLLEHPHVFTVGRNARRSDVVADSGWLERHGVTVAASSRGGQVTYHGPGQLVGYPIVNLDPDRRDIRRYVRDLQQVLVLTLAEFGVAAAGRGAQPEIGVWAGERKVGSIGVHIRRWVTMHGFSLNVTTDLAFFRGIVACGLHGVEMASIESLTGARPAVAEVAAVAARHFAAVFERRLAAPAVERPA
ncbi:MAG: lipoyl(octanoyl) transferase LipB [Acidobacteriota bacterium]|nr:lipoyl(octanoyl) transferase LipB [Acidobacteriota bacterium]